MSEVQFPLTIGATPVEEARSVSHSQQTLTQITSPLDANLLGNVFGGVVLAAVDRVAGVVSARHSGGTCVTASFDQVDFHTPIWIGELVTLKASLNYVGTTSMEIGVRVTAEDPRGGEPRHTNSSYVTMVAIDEGGKPRPVPKLVIENDEQYRRYLDASQRRKTRKHLAAERHSRAKPDSPLLIDGDGGGA